MLSRVVPSVLAVNSRSTERVRLEILRHAPAGDPRASFARNGVAFIEFRSFESGEVVSESKDGRSNILNAFQ